MSLRSDAADNAPSETPVGGGDGEAATTHRPNHYKNGTAFERRIRDDLIDNGYVVIRAAGSKGKIDLFAAKQGQRLAIQCKRHGALGTAEWNQVFDLALVFDAIPILAVGGRGTRYWHLTAPKTQRGKRPMVPFLLDLLAA